MLNTMRDVFTTCQTSISVHHKLLTALKKIHDAADDEEAFFAEFVELLRYSLVRAEKSAPVERTLEFAARFARHLCPSAAEPADDAEQVHPFFQRLFGFLVDSHRAADSAVRLRSCQLLNKLLLHLGENAYLDDALCDRVYEAMLERLQDTVPAVRVQAVFALSRLQEPHNKQCPVIRAYVFHLRNDPSADVRRAVLLNIGGSAATLPPVLERIRDVSAAVRRQAYVFLTKVHIKSIPMSERRRLLREGLQDRDEAVRRTVRRDLLQFWLRLLEGSVEQLLRCLYVEMCPDVAELVVKAMCSETSYADMVDGLALPADSRLFSADELGPERALLWRVLCDHLRAEGGGAEPQLERISPDLPALCGLIQELSGRPPPDGEEEAHRFVLRQLIMLAAGLELWDEFGRRALAQLVEGLLRADRLDVQLVAPLVRLYARAVPAASARLRALVETISEIRAPLQSAPAPAAPAEEPRERRLRRAQLRVRLNELRDQLEAAVAGGDFATAQSVQREQALCQEEERGLQQPEPAADDEPADCPERDDPATLAKCLTVLYELLQSAELRTLTAELRALAETLVLPAVQSEDPAVRELAVRALGALCLLNRGLTEQHLVLFVQVAQADQCEVQLTALRAVFDQLLVHGLEVAAPAEEPEQLAPLVTELTGMLDAGEMEVRGLVAEGLCKLLMHGRISSARLLEWLVLMWYNPVMDGDGFLRNMLGVFFPAFGAAGRASQEMLAEAMLPTLHTLVHAPMTSPLVEVDPDDVARFFVQLTQPGLVPEREAAQPGAVHEALAFRLLNALLDGAGSAVAGRVLGRALTQLELAAASTGGLRDLLGLAERAGREAADPELAADRQLARHISRFRAGVAALLAARPDETPAPTPVARRARPAAGDGDGVPLAAGLDCSQEDSPERGAPAAAAGRVVSETPDSTDVTGCQELFLAASADSDEFDARLREAADASAVRSRFSSEPTQQERPGGASPPPRRPSGRLSRRTPVPKRAKDPASPAAVPTKRNRGQRTAPTSNVRRAPSAGVRSGRPAASDDSPEPEIEDGSEPESPGAGPAAAAGRPRAPPATGRAARTGPEWTPDGAVPGPTRTRRAARNRADRTPDSAIPATALAKGAPRRREKVPEIVVSRAGGTTEASGEERSPETAVPETSAARTRRAPRTKVEQTPDSVFSRDSRGTRGSRGQVEQTPDSVFSRGPRSTRGSRGQMEQTPDSVVSGTSRSTRTSRSQVEQTSDSVVSGTTRRARQTRSSVASPDPVPRKSTRKASTRKI